MEGYKSLREAVESVSSVAGPWHDISTGAWLSIDDLREIAKVYDETTEISGWTYFVTFEESGEICLANTCTKEINFLFVTEGSKYLELIGAQEKRIYEMRQALVPVAYQMVMDKLEEIQNDPEKFVAVFERDSEMLAKDLTDRAEQFIKPGSNPINGEKIRNEDAAKVFQMLRTPGLVMKTAATRNELRNSPEPLIETDTQTVLERLDYCGMN
ncbi:hypothetical protein [Oribacterium sp. NK2B42]|uniref:hypothetical protein n=1 Tax=Oribacterium sp. NK2B42 TaxID=689781 RepID=UPI00041A2CD7|nr:hypothetical protein [Oribacterium sp. NK2B42]